MTVHALICCCGQVNGEIHVESETYSRKEWSSDDCENCKNGQKPKRVFKRPPSEEKPNFKKMMEDRKETNRGKHGKKQ